ncbi:phage tail fiber protein [Klebsiella pneumoniae]|uniref:phage tail fiber protein n=1 Tax=Klebsiella pneumoniae TaxID=573 RepID=UPI00226DD668|nr:phage tail fiber protein [Klebsiella pneumoniae]WAD23318.1 phage tail fiber protein [Klebsiella pneumoniae]
MAITDTQQSAQFAASAAVSAAEAKQYALSIEKPIIDIAESVSEAKDAAVVAGLARDEAKDIASGLSASIDFELAAKEAEFESQMQGQRTAFEVSQQDKESDFLSSQSQREADFVESQTDRENRFQTFLDSSGYVFLGDYENGPFQFSARNQYIRYNNQYYRLNAATDVGFTTTGTDANSFANDVTHFVLMDGDTLRQNLGSSDGLGLVGQCSSLADLRGVEFLSTGQQIFLREHTAGQGMGGGIWYCHSMINDNNYVDDNGCQIINNFGQVLRRKDLRVICSDMFGLMNGGDYIECLRNMFRASRTFCIEDVLVAKLPAGKYYIADTLSDGSNGFVADVSDGMNFTVRGLGVGHNGPMIYHKGNGVLMRIKRNHASSKDFWVACGFECLRVTGRNDTLTGNNIYTGAVAFQASDMWGSLFKDLFIGGYDNNTNGSAISLYNDTAWTEKARFDNVMIRGSVVGLRLHRNTSEGAAATDSFFAVTGEIDMNAGVPNPCSYIRIGDGTEKGRCSMYSAVLTIRGWMSRSSWHTGVDIMDYGVVTGKMTFIWDGYGMASEATTEVLHIIRARGPNARFDCEVTNLSGQLLQAKIHLLQLVWNSCIYTQETTANDASLKRAYPVIRAKGMRLNFEGSFTAAERISGKTYTLSSLLPGQRLRVRLHSFNVDKYQPQISEWDVEVRGTDFPCIVKPLSEQPASLTTESGNALTETTGKTGSFLTKASLADNPFLQHATIGSTTLTLSNGQVNNSVSYAVNSGRRIQIVLPPNPAATEDMPYVVEIEVL